MVVFCLMRTGRAIDCNLFRPIGWGQLEEDCTGQSKGQSFESPNNNKSLEEQRIKSLEAPLAAP